MVFFTGIITPYFAKSRGGSSRGQCVGHLKQIDGAIQQWALENKKLDSDVPDLSAAAKYLKGGVLPQCPHGGFYAAGKTVSDVPTCSLGVTLGHSLP